MRAAFILIFAFRHIWASENGVRYEASRSDDTILRWHTIFQLQDGRNQKFGVSTKTLLAAVGTWNARLVMKRLQLSTASQRSDGSMAHEGVWTSALSVVTAVEQSLCGAHRISHGKYSFYGRHERDEA